MARPKSKGAYAPLAALYYLDDAILEAGPDAELLWLRILSFLASVPQSNGFITDRQIRTVGINLRGVPKRVTSLTEVGLLTAEPGGFAARSWLKWNRSAEEIGKTLAKDRDRKASKHAENEGNSERNPTPFRTDSDPQSSTEQSSTEQVTTEVVTSAAALFDSAWSHWPKKVEKEPAKAAFKTASRLLPPQQLHDVVVRFGDAYAATTENKFVPALGRWLAKKRWTDELPQPERTSRPPTRTEQNLDTVALYLAAENQKQEIES
jgi:hypothetical protein